MTREEIINGLYYIKNWECNGNSKMYEVITNAIKALEQEPNRRTLDADELLKRIAEKCKTPSLSEATVNGLCGATAIIYDMLNESEVENANSN